MSRALGRTDSGTASLRGVGEQTVVGVHGLELVAVGRFLALDAVRGPRHGVQALRADIFLAMHTDPVGTVRDAA